MCDDEINRPYIYIFLFLRFSCMKEEKTRGLQVYSLPVNSVLESEEEDNLKYVFRQH